MAAAGASRDLPTIVADEHRVQSLEEVMETCIDQFRDPSSDSVENRYLGAVGSFLLSNVIRHYGARPLLNASLHPDSPMHVRGLALYDLLTHIFVPGSTPYVDVKRVIPYVISLLDDVQNPSYEAVDFVVSAFYRLGMYNMEAQDEMCERGALQALLGMLRNGDNLRKDLVSFAGSNVRALSSNDPALFEYAVREMVAIFKDVDSGSVVHRVIRNEFREMVHDVPAVAVPTIYNAGGFHVLLAKLRTVEIIPEANLISELLRDGARVSEEVAELVGGI